jgi:hypothetical protein
MEKWLLVVRSNCTDESREDEFNKWYDEVHIPDVMTTPGLVKASRYMSEELGSYEGGKYLAVYEIETDDIDKTMKTLSERVIEVFKKGRLSPLIRGVSFNVFKLMNSLTK